MVFKYPISIVFTNPLKRFSKKTLQPENQDSTLIKRDQLNLFNEALIDNAVQKLGLESIVSAQELFFKFAGKIFVEDPFYDIRMSYFFDILIYEDLSIYYPKIQTQIFPFNTLFDYLISNKPTHIDKFNFTFNHYKNFSKPIHSLFKVINAENESMILRDFFSKKNLTISNQKNQFFKGIAKGSFLQGFMFPCEEGYIASIGIIVHPKPCNRYIKLFLNNPPSTDIDKKMILLNRLAFAQLQQSRMKHVNPFQIYKGVLFEDKNSVYSQ